ncbi:HTH domain-containing protein [Shouchella clausii]|uniref:HTH domain-containing protein n=1 Tax=Shouchella clausii TaxID=79880 RepID=UPI001C73C682|nr:HTH domain-containing protein [Shouchella clausii]MBX0319411.1 HTH domain-containing protein [Shouchella clausii]
MKRKHAEIFQEIVRHKGYVPVKSLSETFQVSARTIRYALEEIDDYLRDHQQPPLKRNRKKGVYYDCDQEVLHKLLGSDTLHFPDAADREAFLVFAFFYAEEKVTVPSICEHLLVSKSTVDKDIQRLRTELLADNLRIDSLPKEGFAVVGSEFAKRRWLFRFLNLP